MPVLEIDKTAPVSFNVAMVDTLDPLKVREPRLLSVKVVMTVPAAPVPVLLTVTEEAWVVASFKVVMVRPPVPLTFKVPNPLSTKVEMVFEALKVELLLTTPTVPIPTPLASARVREVGEPVRVTVVVSEGPVASA